MYDFIHIGQGKCLSTFLQNQWAACSQYDYTHGARIGDELNEIFKTNLKDLPHIQINADPAAPGRAAVLSYECFTFFGVSLVSELAYANLVIERQKFIARCLRGHSNTALIVLRNPVDWILSCHAQYIRYGGHLAAQKYYEAFRTALVDNLNLKETMDVWALNGFSSVVLPMETFRTNPSAFWADYEAQLKLPRPTPSKSSPLQDNVTDQQRLEQRARASELCEFLEKAFVAHPRYQGEDFAAERDQIVNMWRHCRNWLLQRATEAMSAADFHDFEAMMGFQPRNDFRALTLTNQDIDAIAENYIEVLSGLGNFKALVPDYERALIEGSAPK